jgi:hypothetical protein
LHENKELRGVWLSLIVLAGIVAALCAGVTIRASGATLPAALVAGGATFVSTISLGIKFSRFLSG